MKRRIGLIFVGPAGIDRLQNIAPGQTIVVIEGKGVSERRSYAKLVSLARYVRRSRRSAKRFASSRPMVRGCQVSTDEKIIENMKLSEMLRSVSEGCKVRVPRFGSPQGCTGRRRRTTIRGFGPSCHSSHSAFPKFCSCLLKHSCGGRTRQPCERRVGR
jgi:hypothetical protein